MAFDVFQLLNEEGIPYWADFGTLLGLCTVPLAIDHGFRRHREGDIILGDNDVDVCLPNLSEYDLDRLVSRLTQRGYRCEPVSRR